MRTLLHMAGLFVFGMFFGSMLNTPRTMPVKDELAKRLERMNLLLISPDNYMRAVSEICKSRPDCMKAAGTVRFEYNTAIGHFNAALIAYQHKSGDRDKLCMVAEKAVEKAAAQWAAFVKVYTTL